MCFPLVGNITVADPKLGPRDVLSDTTDNSPSLGQNAPDVPSPCGWNSWVQRQFTTYISVKGGKPPIKVITRENACCRHLTLVAHSILWRPCGGVRFRHVVVTCEPRHGGSRADPGMAGHVWTPAWRVTCGPRHGGARDDTWSPRACGCRGSRSRPWAA